MHEIETIQKALQHRPFNEDSSKHQTFLKNLHQKMDELSTKHNIHF
jgi:hypothetical protein